MSPETKYYELSKSFGHLLLPNLVRIYMVKQLQRRLSRPRPQDKKTRDLISVNPHASIISGLNISSIEVV